MLKVESTLEKNIRRFFTILSKVEKNGQNPQAKIAERHKFWCERNSRCDCMECHGIDDE